MSDPPSWRMALSTSAVLGWCPAPELGIQGSACLPCHPKSLDPARPIPSSSPASASSCPAVQQQSCLCWVSTQSPQLQKCTFKSQNQKQPQHPPVGGTRPSMLAQAMGHHAATRKMEQLPERPQSHIFLPLSWAQPPLLDRTQAHEGTGVPRGGGLGLLPADLFGRKSGVQQGILLH